MNALIIMSSNARTMSALHAGWASLPWPSGATAWERTAGAIRGTERCTMPRATTRAVALPTARAHRGAVPYA